MDKITRFNDRIEKIKKEKLKYQTQQAILLKREAEKLLNNNFSPELALVILSDWQTATEAKKKEWMNRSNSFRTNVLQHAQQPTGTRDATAHKNGKESAAENG